MPCPQKLHAALNRIQVQEWAEITPSAVAIVDEARILTYSDVMAESRLLALWLAVCGAKPRTTVASLMEHCAEYILAQLAASQTGAAFFALETHYGPQMLLELLQSTRPIAAFASANMRQKLSAALSVGDATPILTLGCSGWRSEAQSVIKNSTPRELWSRAAPFDTGVITMTSGTSGKPKAIACPMVSLPFAILARNSRYPYVDSDDKRMTRQEREGVNVMFVWEAVRPLCFGQAAVVIPDRVILDATLLAPFLAEHAVTRVLSTPSLLATFLEVSGMSLPSAPRSDPSAALGDRLPRLRLWTVCGEVVPASLVHRTRESLPSVRLVNSYSSWEGSDVSLATLQPSSGDRFAPVGNLIPGVGCAVLHPTSCEPVPIGVSGELYVHSPMMFTAYIGAAELTAHKLVCVPHSIRPQLFLDGGAPFLPAALQHAQGAQRLFEEYGGVLGAQVEPLMYRTGDLARVLPSGELLVLGRADSTVKIRGFKVGLGFVEATLSALPGVARVAVVPLNDEETGLPIALVAHVLPDAESAARAEEDEKGWLSSLREACRGELAAHAVPSHWMLTKELGLSSGESRKLDRKMLPKPDLAGVAHAVSSSPRAVGRLVGVEVSPSEALEEKLAPIWAEVLNVREVQLDDSFFDLGGHSLLAAKLVASISSRLELKLGVLDLFDSPTVRSLANALASREAPLLSSLTPRPPSPPPGMSTNRGVAIIGMAGKFPGADDVDALWRMLCEGRDGLTLWSKAELAAKGVGASVRDADGFVPAAYMVGGATEFDAAFWSISLVEAALMDPQHRMFMQTAWGALESAGYAPRTGSPARTAVFASSGIDGYMIHHLDGSPLKDPLDPGTIFLGEVGSEKDYISTRVSYALDLMGPSLSVNSACSSALSAIAQAVGSLLVEQADMAIGGGCALTFPHFGHLFEEGLVHSIDGKVRPFDAAAHGTVFGDSCGAVVLKRLADAVADDDKIHAVIRGYGITNDGARKAGYSAPGVAGQAAAVISALRMAGVSANTISYVECHATGTLVGDGIEVRALSEAFAAEGGVGWSRCALGSIKGNIGHANAAAGVTGLIKAALCLRHCTLVPTAHFTALNKKVVLEGTPFYVHASGKAAWETSAGMPRRAGVSSFGIGGSNVHMILEEAPSPPGETADGVIHGAERCAHILCISARSDRALGRSAQRLAEWLEANPDADLGRVAHTLHLGRESFAHRAALVAASAQQAAERLLSMVEGAHAVPSSKVGPLFIFPGQGSQHPQMGEGLYLGEPIFRSHVDRMCELLRPLLGFDLRVHIYPKTEAGVAAGGGGKGASGGEPAPPLLFDTPAVTQPAIFVTELALGHTLLSLGVRPVAMAGHSIGEFVAATLCGVFSEEAALRLIAARARLSQEAPEGRMLLCPVDATRALSLTQVHRDKLWLAVSNAPRRQVLAGEPSAVAAVEAALKTEGLKPRMLPVNRAYHTPLMSGAQAALLCELDGVELKPPALPLACNGRGGWMSPQVAVDPSYWAAHVATAVLWAANMEVLATKAPAQVVEIGAGSSLFPLLSECTAPNADALWPLPTLRHPREPFAAGVADAEAFGSALAALWEQASQQHKSTQLATQAPAPRPLILSSQRPLLASATSCTILAARLHLHPPPCPKFSPSPPRSSPSSGSSINWKLYHAGERYLKMELPSYSFEPTECWVNPMASMHVMPTPEQVASAQAALDAAAAVQPPLTRPLLVRLRPAVSPEKKWVTTYCLAYAGGSTAAFSELARAAPEWMEVVGIEMPGKGELADFPWPGEPAVPAAERADDAEERMMASLAEEVAADAAGSALVLMGWSMGGMLATELALFLEKAGCRPQLLHVAGRMAPGSFIPAGEDVDKYLLASEEMKQTEAWSTWLLPMLMADLRADARAEARVARTIGPYAVLQVCAGDSDFAFPLSSADAWAALSRGGFEKHTLSGGHDILQSRAIDLLRLVTAALIPQSPLYAVKWLPLATESAETAGTAPMQLLRGCEQVCLTVVDGGASRGVAEAEFPRLTSALAGSHGLLVHLPSVDGVGALEAQCWQLLQLVGQLGAAGGAGRMVLLCPADGFTASLAAGASKAVPLEYPELMVQRLFLPKELDLLRCGGMFGRIESVVQGWLSWLAAVASQHASETDVWLHPAPPHAPFAPRLLPQPLPPPSSLRAVNPRGTYLVTGGSGGLGGAIVAWLLYEQHIPPAQLILLSRRGGDSPHAGVRTLAVDLSSAHTLEQCDALRGIPNVDGIFHLAGVLDDGLISNMTPERLHKVVAPKAGLLPLLSLCSARGWVTQWVLAASSTSSLLGYAGQANYCAANSLFDNAVAFGLPNFPAGATPKLLTLNFGPWGEVGMAREGTKAHQLSLLSGELPMASSAAISCIAEALRRLQGDPALARAASLNLSSQPGAHGLQFAVADMEWWRSPWPSHPLLQGVMHRLPPATASAVMMDTEVPVETDKVSRSDSARTKMQVTSDSLDRSKSRDEVEGFLKSRMSVWDPSNTLLELGLDSLDLVQLRNAFQKQFKLTIPMGIFTNANQTLLELTEKLAGRR
ncbi:MAG: hypothetical protein SGPRY_002309 [Prymnesium sp.]